MVNVGNIYNRPMDAMALEMANLPRKWPHILCHDVKNRDIVYKSKKLLSLNSGSCNLVYLHL